MIFLVIGIPGAFMYLVTTFLFYFRNFGPGIPYRILDIVNYGALAVIGATLLIAAIAWRLRSPAAALLSAAIAAPIAWAAALFVEWRLSLT